MFFCASQEHVRVVMVTGCILVVLRACRPRFFPLPSTIGPGTEIYGIFSIHIQQFAVAPLQLINCQILNRGF